jgi:hypothetical protein
MKRLHIIASFLILTEFFFVTGQPFNSVVLNGDTLITFSIIFKQYPNYKKLNEKLYNELESEDMIVNPQNYVTNEHEAFDYNSTWVVKNNKLILTEIKSGSNKIFSVDLLKFFGAKVKDGVVLADWLTDTITLCKGKLLAEGIDPIYENEFELKLKNGYLTEKTSYKNYIANISKFRADESFIYSRIDWDRLPDFKNKFIQAYIGIKPNEDGQFESFDDGSFVFEDSKVVTDKDNAFLKEAFRIARLIPEWDVIFRKNKIVSQPLMIFFDNKMKIKYAR